jgi:serine/threonine protein kinase
MRFYEYGNLKTAIYNRDRNVKSFFSEEEWCTGLIVEFAYDIARGLAEIHHTGVVHNDMKVSQLDLKLKSSGIY